jgi:hypothetical protein
MSPVKGRATFPWHGLETEVGVGLAEGCIGLGVELETTVDQALIRGLGTAFRVFVSGLSSV